MNLPFEKVALVTGMGRASVRDRESCADAGAVVVLADRDEKSVWQPRTLLPQGARHPRRPV